MIAEWCDYLNNSCTCLILMIPYSNYYHTMHNYCLNEFIIMTAVTSEIKEWLVHVSWYHGGYTSVSRQWTFLCHVREWPCLTFDPPLAVASWLLEFVPATSSSPSLRAVLDTVDWEGKDSRTMSGGQICPFEWPLLSSFSSLASTTSLTLLVLWITSGSSCSNLLLPIPAAPALNSIDPSSECSCSSWWSWFAESSMRLR